MPTVELDTTDPTIQAWLKRRRIKRALWNLWGLALLGASFYYLAHL
jgi:hypothetical protein